MAFGWNIGRRKRPSPQPVEIKNLLVGKEFQLEVMVLKELMQHIVRNILVVNLGVVGTATQQQVFIRAQKGRGIDEPVIPQDHNPAAGLQDAFELGMRPRPVEPVKACPAATRSTLASESWDCSA